jgi:hypothetical protein
MEIKVKEWFENKLVEELNLGRIYSLELFCGIKETEKAVYAMFYTGHNCTGCARHKCHWIPKSAIENVNDITYIDDYEKAVYAFGCKYMD